MRLLVTRDDYYAAAMRILATEGAGGLKIATLCRELGVTTGSFYGYFGSLDGFIEQFLAYWWESQTARIAAIVTDVELREGRTWYSQLGDLPWVVMMVLLLGLSWWGFRRQAPESA